MNVAILLRNNLDFSQLSMYASRHINASKDHNIVTCCVNNIKPAFKVDTANLPLTDINLFNGLIISTCIDTTMFAKSMVRRNDILFYVWDLEWHRRGNKDYFRNIAAFRNVLLATRSNSYAMELLKYSGVKTDIITPDFNVSHLIDRYEHLRQTNS